VVVLVLNKIHGTYIYIYVFLPLEGVPTLGGSIDGLSHSVFVYCL